MSGQSHWLDLVVLLLGAVLVFGGLWALTRSYRLKRVAKRLVCPVKDAEVDLVLLEHSSTHAFVDVERCSAFDHPKDVRCGQECRRALNASRA